MTKFSCVITELFKYFDKKYKLKNVAEKEFAEDEERELEHGPLELRTELFWQKFLNLKP